MQCLSYGDRNAAVLLLPYCCLLFVCRAKRLFFFTVVFSSVGIPTTQCCRFDNFQGVLCFVPSTILFPTLA